MSPTDPTEPPTRLDRPDVPAVATSIRMSPGTREAYNFARDVLNRNRSAGEPPWTLGEVIELSLSEAYKPWRKMRAVIGRSPRLQVRFDAG